MLRIGLLSSVRPFPIFSSNAMSLSNVPGKMFVKTAVSVP